MCARVCVTHDSPSIPSPTPSRRRALLRCCTALSAFDFDFPYVSLRLTLSSEDKRCSCSYFNQCNGIPETLGGSVRDDQRTPNWGQCISKLSAYGIEQECYPYNAECESLITWLFVAYVCCAI